MFLLPQVKRGVMIKSKNDIYELRHKLLDDLGN